MRSFEVVSIRSKSSACTGYEELLLPYVPTPTGIFLIDVGVAPSSFNTDFDLVDNIPALEFEASLYLLA